MIDPSRLALALLIFAASLVAILVRPRGISEAVSSSLGALLMVIAGIIPVAQAVALLLDSWNILLFFAGLVVVAWATEQSGFFRWVALWAARLAAGDARRLLRNILALGVLITTFLSNDATALLLTPVIASVAEETSLPPVPFALACAFIANTASVTLPVSNPINILILEHFHLRLNVYLAQLLAPSLFAIAINVALFPLLFRKQSKRQFSSAALATPDEAISNATFFHATLVCLGVLSLAYVAGSLLGWPLSLVALGGAIALLLSGIALGGLPVARVRRIPWNIVPFIAGLLVLVQGLENAGATDWLATQLVSIAGHGRFAGVFAAVIGSALGANVINNLPMATVMASTIRRAQVQPLLLRRGLVASVIFGCDVGPNLTALGSLSTILSLMLLRRKGLWVTSWDYMRVGLIITPPMLFLGALLIAILH